MATSLRDKINRTGRKLLDAKTNKERDRHTRTLQKLDPNGIEMLSMIRDVFSFNQQTKDRGCFGWGWTQFTIRATKEFSRHELRVLYCMAEVLNRHLQEYIALFKASENAVLPEPEGEDFIKDLEAMMAEPLDLTKKQEKALENTGILKKKKKSRRTPNQRNK